MTVYQKPENLQRRNLRQVLIRFSGPPDTSVNVDGQQRTKVQGRQSFSLISLTFFLSII